MNGVLLPLRESVQYSWRASGRRGGGEMGKERVSKRKRARGREVVFNKEAALYGNVMNTVDKKRERQKL